MLVGQDPEGRRQIFGPLHQQFDVPLAGLHLQLVGDLLRERHDVERLHFEPRHVAFEFGDRVEVVDDIDQPVDALFRTFEILAVDEFVFQSAVEQRRNIPLNIENRGFQFMRHIAEILLAELLRLFQAGDLHVAGLGPCRQLFGDALHVLVLQLVENLVRMHVARKDDRIDRF